MDFMSRKKIFFAVSITLILVGLITVIVSGLNFGIDFTGGTLLQFSFGREIPVSEAREVMDEYDATASIIHAGDNNEQVIIKTTLALEPEERTEILNKFKEKYSPDSVELIQTEKFGPAIGEEIRNRAIISVLIATVGMLLYITFRFEFLFGVSAIIALVHDVLIALAVYAVLRIPVNSSFVAAMLTIVGYSINDTIVVFDRIRENNKLMRKEEYDVIVNKSISQTLVRSINTSFTTLLAIVTLYVLGVEAIKDFALPLIVGVLAGTYSSIFIASPVWFILKSKLTGKSFRKKRA